MELHKIGPSPEFSGLKLKAPQHRSVVRTMGDALHLPPAKVRQKKLKA
jgi:hypothetical protein